MFQKLTIAQKQFLTILIPIVIIGGSLGVYSYFNSQNLPLNQVQETQTEEVVQRGQVALNKLKETNKNDPQDLIFIELTFEELNIYPTGWVKSNFTSQQQSNQLISGSAADPDQDGITNLREFLYGSNPNNKYTYCGGEATQDCKDTDGDLVQKDKSPLTGITLETPKTFKLKRVDEKIVQNMKDSLGVASEQGIDFPKLYEQSRTLNLDDEVSKIDIITQDTTRESILKYYESRLEILRDSSQEDELTAFTNVYGLLEPEKLQTLEQKYLETSNKLKKLAVPKSLANFHKVSIYSIDKLLEITQHRQQTITSGSFNQPDQIEKGQRLARELFWSYRKANTEQNKIGE